MCTCSTNHKLQLCQDDADSLDCAALEVGPVPGAQVHPGRTHSQLGLASSEGPMSLSQITDAGKGLSTAYTESQTAVAYEGA